MRPPPTTLHRAWLDVPLPPGDNRVRQSEDSMPVPVAPIVRLEAPFRVALFALPALYLRFAARQASRDEVLRLAGVDYEAARREAARAGLPPPKRFVEALRLLRAVSVLERGERVKEVAPAYGFHDAERLARRMRRHFDVTPTQARALGPVALLDHLERKWFGDAVAH